MYHIFFFILSTSSSSHSKSQTSSSVLDFLLTPGPAKQIHTHWMTIQRQLMRVPKSLPWTKESLLLCAVDASISLFMSHSGSCSAFVYFYIVVKLFNLFALWSLLLSSERELSCCVRSPLCVLFLTWTAFVVVEC